MLINGNLSSVVFSGERAADPMQFVSIMAVGDICLGGRLKEFLIPSGSQSAFQQCESIIKGNDILFGNLEMVIVSDTSKIVGPAAYMAVSMETAHCIVDAGFNILSLANNHILDCGPEATEETLTFLSRNGIAFLGYGKNREEAWTAKILTVKGQRLAFIAMADSWRQGAGSHRPGAAVGRQKKAIQMVTHLRQKADHVIVSYHADLEFYDYPDPQRVRFARRLLKNGATLVLQHHPHVPQGIEVSSKGLIAYSLGNFVFDVDGDEYLKEGSEFCKISFALKILLGKLGIAKVEIVPVGIDNIGRPYPLIGMQRQSVIRHVYALSRGLKDETVLWKNWFRICRNRMINEAKWFLFTLYKNGPIPAAKRVLHLAGLTETRRWFKGFLIYVFQKVHLLRYGQKP